MNKIADWYHQVYVSYKLHKIIRKHKRVAAYLNKKYILPYFENKADKWTVLPKQKLGTDKVIWQLWYQGINEQTPPVIRACFDSIDRNMQNYQIIRLTKDTIKEYLDLPDFAYQKIDKGFKLAHFSDLLRVCLLYVYGGVWMDAKILLTGPVEERLLNRDFFLFQRTQQPPEDERFWEEYYAKYFSWKPDFKVRSLNSFIVAKPENKLLEIMKDILLNFWKNETKVRHYFWFQILYNEIISRPDCQSLNCDIINDIDIHRLEPKLRQPWTDSEWQAIQQASSMHKLRLIKQDIPGSFYSKISESAP